MGMNKPLVNQADPLDGEIAKMVGPSEKAMEAINGALRGVSSEASTAFADLTQVTTALRSTGSEVAARIKAIESDSLLPMEHRMAESRKLRGDGELLTKKLLATGNALLPKVEAGLEASLLPRHHADLAQRAQIQREVEARFGHLRGTELATAIIARVGRDVRHDSEVLDSGWGASFLAGRDAEAHVEAIRRQAVEKYAGSPPGITERQKAAARALGVWRSSNPQGIVVANHTAGLMKLHADDRLPGRRTQ